MRNRKDTRRELTRAFEAVEAIRTAETVRDADVMTGFAVGVAYTKAAERKLSYKTSETIARLAEAVGETQRKRIEERYQEAETE